MLFYQLCITFWKPSVDSLSFRVNLLSDNHQIGKFVVGNLPMIDTLPTSLTKRSANYQIDDLKLPNIKSALNFCFTAEGQFS